MIQVAFLLVAERFAVGDEKLKIARIRMIDVRVVNFINDPMAEREPKAATGVVSRAHALLGAGVQRGSIPGAPNATKFSVGFFIVPGSATVDQTRRDDN